MSRVKGIQTKTKLKYIKKTCEWALEPLSGNEEREDERNLDAQSWVLRNLTIHYWALFNFSKGRC
jgi:hypothetical protein